TRPCMIACRPPKPSSSPKPAKPFFVVAALGPRIRSATGTPTGPGGFATGRPLLRRGGRTDRAGRIAAKGELSQRQGFAVELVQHLLYFHTAQQFDRFQCLQGADGANHRT